jgi:mRNA interferase MazF
MARTSVRRGEVWLINLDPAVGAEIKKTRPAVIVNDDAVGALPLRVIVPLTEWKERFGVAPWLVRVEPDAKNGLEKASAADAFQVRSVSQQRFVRPLGRLPEAVLHEITRALATVLSIEYPAVSPEL